MIELQERHALATLQNPPRQAGEHSRRPHFHEHPHARLIELLDHAHPADRLGHLPDQAVLDVRRVGEQCRRRAAIGRHPRCCDRNATDGPCKFVCRGREERRVERAGHGEPFRFHAAGFEDHLDGVDDPGRAADHRLLGRVFRAHPDLPRKRLDRRLHRREIGDHRQHRAIPRAVTLDGIGPCLRRPSAVLDAPRAHGGQRRKFAKAVAGDEVR